MSGKFSGFPPFYNADSEVLILGSFPSVKSREASFYYGNPRNAFWRILSAHFGESTPSSVEEKKDFLTRRKIALWDVVTECEITASRDDTIKNYKVADLNTVLSYAPIHTVIINGGKAYSIFKRHYGQLAAEVRKLPSTSPANTRLDEGEWHACLSAAFAAKK